jgi:hypothetical protein
MSLTLSPKIRTKKTIFLLIQKKMIQRKMQLMIHIFLNTNKKYRLSNRMYSKLKSIFIVCSPLLSLLIVMLIFRNRIKSFHLILYRAKSFSLRLILKIRLKIFLIYCTSVFLKLKAKMKFREKFLKSKSNNYKNIQQNKNKYFKM